jgi:threonine/homoserine/homoserine lactone efflux protein
VPPLATLPVFLAASLVLLAIPGPAVLYIVSRSASQGTRAGLLSVLGVHAGSVVHVCAAVAGLSTIVLASSVAFTAVKLAGGVYLLWIGAQTIRGARAVTDVAVVAPRPRSKLFTEGFVVNVLNPKVALFFVAFLPQFVAAGSGPVWSQTLVLGLLYIAVGLCSDSLYALLGGRVGRWFHHRADRLRRTRYAEGGILVGLGVLTLALPHRPST